MKIGLNYLIDDVFDRYEYKYSDIDAESNYVRNITKRVLNDPSNIYYYVYLRLLWRIKEFIEY